MITLSPSILSADLLKLGDECSTVLEAGADMIHFDVMDGCFVDNISFGIPVLSSLKHHLPDAVMDVHLMVDCPLRFISRFAEAGANFLTVHVETKDNLVVLLSSIRALGCRAGIAVSPYTPIEASFPYLDQVDLVLVMGVEPGHGGQAFIPQTIDKLSLLRKHCDSLGLHPLISVDGGVKPGTTAPQCVAAGANTLVVGSAVFQASDVTAIVRSLKEL